MKIHNNEQVPMAHYFVKKKKYCHAFFKRAAVHGKKAIINKYGHEKGLRILERVRQEYGNLLCQAPYVGKIDLLERQMLLTVLFAAIYRVLKENETIEDIWKLCCNFNRETLMGMPSLVRWLLKQATFSKRMKNSFKKRADEHKQDKMPDQWEYVEGDGKTFDYGINMTSCAKLMFLEKIGAANFAPYVCLIDKNFAECCNYGLKRSMVLAEGADHCDFRLSKTGPIDVVSSVDIQLQ